MMAASWSDRCPTRLYIVRTAVVSTGGLMRTAASAAASGASIRDRARRRSRRRTRARRAARSSARVGIEGEGHGRSTSRDVRSSAASTSGAIDSLSRLAHRRDDLAHAPRMRAPCRQPVVSIGSCTISFTRPGIGREPSLQHHVPAADDRDRHDRQAGFEREVRSCRP